MKLTHRTGAKIAAAILLFVFAAMTVGGVIGIVAAADCGAYTANTFVESRRAEQAIYGRLNLLLDMLYSTQEDIKGSETPYTGIEAVQYAATHYAATMRSNVLFELEDADGNVVVSTYDPEIRLAQEREFYDGEWSIRVGIREELLPIAGDVVEEDVFWFDVFRSTRYLAIALAAVGAIVCVLLVIFLICAAGHSGYTDEIVLNPIDRAPFDLLAGIEAVGVVLIVDLLEEIFGADFITGVILMALSAAAALHLTVSFAARCKAKTFPENTLTVRLLRLLWKGLKALGRAIKSAYRALPMLGKSIPVLGGAAFLELLLAFCMAEAPSDAGAFFILLLILNAALVTAGLYGVFQMKKLRETAEKLASGDLSYKLDTSRMYWEFRKHGDDLNAVGVGIGTAVEQRMKSERLKTELITNVSHDIKTPLTSIVSYVDLLQRPELTEDERKDYLAVLARQSARLKKLTEDLVEASKASTGNIPVTLVPTNLSELLNQAAAEYAERLAAGRLEPILTADPELAAQADGRLLWRVLDNLLGNVCKYGLAGTRVYLTAEKRDEKAVITVRNISRDPLNLSAEELMERFVRGDRSRSTEGSGLGLSIARSLTELQGGSFRLSVDGDLFKAEVILNL